MCNVTDLPYPFQREAIDELTLNSKYLAFDMGLGKTRVALETAQARNAKRIVVVCPATVRLVWQTEGAKWWPNFPVYILKGAKDAHLLNRPHGIFVLSYGLMQTKESAIIRAIQHGPEFDMAVFDEAHALKNPGAIRTRTLLIKLFKKFKYVLPMSGTPMPNHAGELYPMLRVMWPETIKDFTGDVMDKDTFTRIFCETDRRYIGNGRTVDIVTGSKNLDELRARTKGIFIRRRRNEVLKQLPPVRVDLIPVDGGEFDTGGINFDEMSNEELMNALSNSPDGHIATIRRQLGLAKLDSVSAYLAQVLDEDLPRDEKVVVFAHHKGVIDHLRHYLAAFNPAVIVGATPQKDREIQVGKFLNDNSCRVFIGNILAAGTGLTLFGPNAKCRHVYFAETSFSPGENAQAIARIHRIGQTGPVDAGIFYVPGSFDERVQDILARKTADITQMGL